jgi:hypothetical protein
VTASAFLARSELRDWSGRHNREPIIVWLKERRIAFTLDADDWPKVARELHDRLHGLAAAGTGAQHSEPDFSALKRSAA